MSLMLLKRLRIKYEKLMLQKNKMDPFWIKIMKQLKKSKKYK